MIEGFPKTISNYNFWKQRMQGVAENKLFLFLDISEKTAIERSKETETEKVI